MYIYSITSCQKSIPIKGQGPEAFHHKMEMHYMEHVTRVPMGLFSQILPLHQLPKDARQLVWFTNGSFRTEGNLVLKADVESSRR